jgi:hypothetical protein
MALTLSVGVGETKSHVESFSLFVMFHQMVNPCNHASIAFQSKGISKGTKGAELSIGMGQGYASILVAIVS